MSSRSVLGRAVTTLFQLLLVVTVVSFWFRYEFAQSGERSAALQRMGLEIENGVLAEPHQQAINAPAFNTERNGIRYSVSPLYDYRLQGVVVSLRAHDGDYGLHRIWGDHLNISDICVVWGENAASLDLNEFDFWSGEFTCNLKVGSRELYEQFQGDQLSNNHLLVDRESVREQVAKIKIGDVVKVRGQLAKYDNGSGQPRGTSTVRTDSGNGACETIYVEDLRIVGDVRTFWYPLFWYSLWAMLLIGVVWIYGVGWGHF